VGGNLISIQLERTGEAVSEPAFSENPKGSSSQSQKISEMLGGLLEKSIGQFQTELTETTKAIRELTKFVSNLERDMHHPPCSIVSALKTEFALKLRDIEKRMEDHRKDHEKEQEEREQEARDRKSFVRSIQVVVFAALILAVLGLAVVGFQNGANPTGMKIESK